MLHITVVINDCRQKIALVPRENGYVALCFFMDFYGFYSWEQTLLSPVNVIRHIDENHFSETQSKVKIQQINEIQHVNNDPI